MMGRNVPSIRLPNNSVTLQAKVTCIALILPRTRDTESYLAVCLEDRSRLFFSVDTPVGTINRAIWYSRNNMYSSCSILERT